MFAGIFAVARAGIFEKRRRRILAAERPIVTQIDPDAARSGLELRQHRHRRVVGMDAFGRQDCARSAHDRIERHHAGADPIGHRRRVEFDALASIGRRSAG